MSKNLFVFFGLVCLILSSCTSKEEILYFQDVQERQNFRPENYKSIIKNNDRLSINVSSADMTSASRFNRLVPGISDASDFRANGQPLLQDYLVSNEGFVNLPTLGKWKVAGKSRFELEQELLEEYQKYLKDAAVNVRITNFKITVLGEVQRPGTYTIPDERVTILQALGLAGDLTLYGKRNDVLLFRDRNGVEETYKIDLTTSDVLDSDLYYLQQNDVLYVGPNNAQVNGASFNRNNPLYVSIASLLLSVVILIAR